MSGAELDPGTDWAESLGTLAPPSSQPTHAEILARLAAMRPVRHGPDLPPDSFEAIQARILAAQDALPVQHCVTCGEPFRHRRPGRCWDCTAKARRRE